MRILITGSNGLLGQKIAGQLLDTQSDFLATSYGVNRNPNLSEEHYTPLDITDQEAVAQIIASYRPDAVINTAAMTNVDQCETQREECDRINVDAVSYLAEACLENGAHLIHLSTDFVFNGENGPYREEDEPAPLSYYGESKYKAERIIQEMNGLKWSIVRTIIVFGTAPGLSRSNIVLWAREALHEGKPLSIVDDQFRAPTLAEDLAWACIRIVELGAQGIYHISGPQTFSIYELVERVARFYGLDTGQISRTSSADLNQAAKRPPRTGFDISKAVRDLGYAPRTFEEGLELVENQLVS